MLSSYITFQHSDLIEVIEDLWQSRIIYSEIILTRPPWSSEASLQHAQMSDLALYRPVFLQFYQTLET